ncbi:MAG: methyltransferase domain-containing protein [Dehalococcoidales bacterium]|nr:methyltransferase domain-containing protein [Dehalococcoidales bacterium]
MSNTTFGLMVLTMSVEDLFHKPVKKLKKFVSMCPELSVASRLSLRATRSNPSTNPQPPAPSSHPPVLSLLSGKVVVDYACGPGRYTIPTARMVGPTGKVFAIDIQPLAIDIVKREGAKAGLANIEARLIDSFDTGLPDATADVVLLIDAITPITDREPLLKEIHRLLKPEGVLFVDSSHMSVKQAQAIVEETNLFDLVKVDGKEMVWGKRKQS